MLTYYILQTLQRQRAHVSVYGGADQGIIGEGTIRLPYIGYFNISDPLYTEARWQIGQIAEIRILQDVGLVQIILGPGG